MPQSIYIFDLERHALPLPRDVKDFSVLLEALGGREDTRNPKFMQLGMRLDMRFSGAKPSIWLNNPIEEAMSLRQAVWHFELPPADAHSVFLAVVEMADSLGLVVYSDDVGVGFLPGGIIIPADAAMVAPARPVEAGEPFREPSHAIRVLQPLLAQCLAPAGFATMESEWPEYMVFGRTVGTMRQKISLRVLSYLTLDGSLSVYHDSVTAVYTSAIGRPYEHEPVAMHLDIDFFHPGLDVLLNWNIEHTGHIPLLLALLRDKLIPLANLCSDLRGIDQVMSDPTMSEVRTVYPSAPVWSRPIGASSFLSLPDAYLWNLSRLVVARLAGNPEFDRILTDFDNQIERREIVIPRWEAEQFDRFRVAILAAQPLMHWNDTADFLAARKPTPPSLLPKPTDPRERRFHARETARLLWRQADEEPQLFWDRFATGDGFAALQARWNEVGEKLPLKERVDQSGLACLVLAVPQRETSGRKIVLLEFPPSTRVGEWQALALVQGADGFIRYSVCNPGNQAKLEALLKIERTIAKAGGITSYAPSQQNYDRQWLLAHIAATLPD